MKVLLTNFNILNYSGSEIDTVTIANYFINKKYDVTIFTMEYGYPLQSILDPKVKIITPNDISKLNKNYDLIWAHHYPLLDYLLFILKIKANHIVYISLSSVEPLEMLPDYYQELSIIGANSKMVIDVLTKQMPIKKDIIVFPNYAPNIYFHNKIKKVEKIIKICIVSNHVPKELNDFQKIAIANGIKVDIYGIGNIEKYVDNNVLSEYDLIISIGKTIYYALAMGKLAYCYDRFGGYGFINSKNIDECFQKNFSGKGFGKFLTGQEIYNDIIENFKNTNKCLKKMQEYAFSYFNFENNIKKILNSLTVSNKVNCSNLIKKYSMLEIKAKLYVESINIKNNIINEKNNIINEKNNIINAQNENLKSIYQSTSWKLTVPIRYMKKIIYKLLNK